VSDTAPLYQRIKQALRDEIDEGRFDPAVPFVTQREVCERFGVSTITAVRALNDLVADGVLVRRRGQGTFVAASAGLRRTAATRDHATVACIVNGLHGLRGAHLAHILVTVEARCAENGYQLLLFNSAESTAREEDALRRAYDQSVDGIVLYPVQGRAHADVIAEARRRRVPLVMLDRYRPDVPTDAVVADNNDLGYQLTERLIAQGHERIATLWGETECTSVVERHAGHVQAVRDHHLPIRPALAVLSPYEPLPEKQRVAALENLLGSAEPPSVLLCANGYVLTAAAHDLSVLGLRVPEDIDLACMDDTGPYDLLRLAAVEGILPSEEMARKAMDLLVQRMTSGRPYGRPARRIVLPVAVREREIAHSAKPRSTG
jgi:GntR family transcriptional regulator of arabinose operon